MLPNDYIQAPATMPWVSKALKQLHLTCIGFSNSTKTVEKHWYDYDTAETIFQYQEWQLVHLPGLLR